MKNLKLFTLLSFVLLLASCANDDIENHEMVSSHDFLIEDIMGTQIDHVIYDNGISVNRNGFTVNGDRVNGKYVINSASGGRGGIYSGLAFTIAYSIEMDEGNEGFTKEMFHEVWEVDKRYEIVTEGFLATQNSLYYGVVEGDSVIQYESEINDSESNNYIKILSQKYIGLRDDSRNEVYEIELEFNSRMVNSEDPMDVIYVKDGTATVRVVYFTKD